MNQRDDLKTFEKAARMLKAVAHPIRIKIINCLIKKEKLSVGTIQSKLNISQSMTSQHLASLKNIGVLGCEKQANICYYYIENRSVLKLLDCVEHCSKKS